MPKHLAETVSDVMKGADDQLVTWPKAFVAVLVGVAIAFFANEKTFCLVFIVPSLLLLAFALHESCQRQPRHGKFGRIGTLSRSELTKAQAKLLRPKGCSR